ncbi:MAG: hypothetical protein AAB074_23605 [Planctomycetota bacterium]
MSDVRIPDGYRTQAEDTSFPAEAIQLAAWKRLPPEERVRRLWELSDFVRRLAETSVRQRHPRATEREVQFRVASRRLGRDLMMRAFDWDPDVHGY